MKKRKKQCAYCDHGYFENRRLLQHIAKVHNGKKQELIKIFTLHSEESQKEQSEHDLKFERNLGSQKHQNNCTICNLQFPKSINLIVHNAIVHSMFVVLRDISDSI